MRINSPKKKGVVRTLIWVIIDVLIVLVVVYFILGYFNFFKISKEQKPLFDGTVKSYTKNEGEVTVNNYKIYKIVKYKIPNKNISYSMKLWFMEDVK